MGFKEIIQKNIEDIMKTGFEDKRRSLFMAAMLAARDEPYCSMVDLLMISNVIEEMLEE